MLSITVSNPKTSLPLSMVSIPAPTTSLSTHFLQNSQTILTSSKKISLRNQRKLQFKHSLSISCGVTRIVNRIEFSAWKSLPTPHPAACPTKHARLTQRMHVGQVSENATETNTYSVWAIPPKETTEKIKKLMENLRSEFGGPEFEPHFTVVGPNEKTESDAINMFNSACQGVKPYTATVDSVVQGPSYYESVYCLLQPSKELLETAAHCSKYFGHDIPNVYMLHVSLLFGDFRDEVKQEIIEKAEAFYPNLTSLSFQTSQLALWRTNTDDQTLETWGKVAEYDLV